MKKIIIANCFECPHIKVKMYTKTFFCKSSDQDIFDPFDLKKSRCPLDDSTEQDESRMRSTWYSQYYGV